MPISKSAKKALRSSLKKTSENRRRKAVIKAATKDVTKETLPKAMSLIDKGVKWGLFHKNKAARLKSRLSKTVGSIAGVTKHGTDKPVVKKVTAAKKAIAKKLVRPLDSSISLRVNSARGKQAQGKPAAKTAKPAAKKVAKKPK